MVWLSVFEIANVRTGVDACDCIRGLYGHRNRVDRSRRKIVCRAGIQTRVSIAPGFSVGRSTHWAIPVQTQKGSNERLFILTRTHSIQTVGEIPFIKPQNDTWTTD